MTDPTSNAASCSYRGRKGEPVWDYARGIFPCFRKASVRLREVSDREHFGNPFRERDVCRVHADEMIASGWYMEVGARIVRDA